MRKLLLVILLLFGGSRFKVMSQTWTQLANVPFQSVVDTSWNIKYGCGFVIGSNIYYLPADTSRLWCYNTLTATWSRKAIFPAGLRVNACGFAIEPYGYITCGHSYGTTTGQMSDLWQYNPTTDQWVQKASSASFPREYAIVFVINGKAYLGGGASTTAPALTPYIQSLREYNPATDTWTNKAAIPDVNNPPFKTNGRGMATAFAFGGFGYVLNGIGNGSLLTDTRQYNPVTNTWATLSPAFGNNLGGTGISEGNRGFICFGQAGTSQASYSFIWQLDSTFTWTAKSNFPGLSRKFASGFTVGCNTYILGGQNYNAANVPSHTNLVDFWKSECHTLPITLLSFEAQCAAESQTVLVKWSTASENNCKAFLLRFSYANQTYEKVVAANGTTNLVSNYYLPVILPHNFGLNQTRLGIFELNSNVDTTFVMEQFLHCETIGNSGLKVYPNPSSINGFTLEGPQLNPAFIKVIDAVGQNVNYSYACLTDDKLHIVLDNIHKQGFYYLMYEGSFVKILMVP